MNVDANGVESKTCAVEREYVAPNLEHIDLRHAFPNRIIGDVEGSSWPYLRRLPGQVWHVDRRNPTVGFTSLDEATILFNAARLLANRPCLEIGCWRGWSTAHIAAGSGNLDVIDPILADPAFLADVQKSLAAAGILDRVQLNPGSSPEAVETLATLAAKRWSFIFIDGNHDGDAPRIDAEVVARHAANTAMVVFHDLLSPDVAAGLDHFRRSGWQVGLYYTSQMMGVAWRGQVTPVPHLPDPCLPKELPPHLAGCPILSDITSLRPSRNNIEIATLPNTGLAGVDPPISAAEFDRLHKRLIALIIQINAMHSAAAQQAASLDTAEKALEEEKRLRLQAERQLEQLAAERTDLSAQLQRLSAKVMQHAASLASAGAALKEENRLRLRAEKRLQEVAAERAKMSVPLERLSAKQAELVEQLDRPIAADPPGSPSVNSAQLAAIAETLTRPRVLLHLTWRRFSEDPAQSRERLATMIADLGLDGAHRQAMAEWLMSRRVLVGLLRRRLLGNGSAARLAILVNLLHIATLPAAPASIREITDPAFETREAARLEALEAAKLADEQEILRLRQEAARLGALEAAKLADEQEILRLRLKMLSYEGQIESPPAAAA